MENLSDYRREMDRLHFTAEQKARLAARISNAAEKEPPAARRPIRRVLAAAAAVAVVFAVGGGAAAAGLVGDFFAPVFGTSRTEVVNQIGRPIGAGATDHGITITADAIIGDKYNACIVYTIKRGDGSPLGLPAGVSASELSFEQGGFSLHGGASSHGASWFTESKSNGNAAQYVEQISVDGLLNPGRARVDFHNLQYFDQESGKMVTLCDGDWTFGFDVSYEDSSVALSSGKTFAQNGISFTITGVSVSPVGLHLEYEADGEADLTGDSSGDGRESPRMTRTTGSYLRDISVILTKKDGSKLDLTDFGGSIKTAGGKTTCVKSGVFREIVPIEDIKSVSVGGTEIPVDSGR